MGSWFAWFERNSPEKDGMSVPINASADKTKSEFLEAVKNDAITNATVVSSVGLVTNTYWEWVDLKGLVGSKHAHVVGDTTAKVGLPVIGICTILDGIRRVATKKDKNWREACREYFDSNEWEDSFKLGIKFFGGVVGWTAGNTLAGMDGWLGTWGAAIGNSLGLFIACEAINLFDIFFHKKAPSNMAAFKVAVCGFFEGMVWSIIDRANIDNGVLHSLAVGAGSAGAFTMASPAATTFEKIVEAVERKGSSGDELPGPGSGSGP